MGFLPAMHAHDDVVQGADIAEETPVLEGSGDTLLDDLVRLFPDQAFPLKRISPPWADRFP